MHIKISWYLLRIWQNDDDGNLKADQCHGQLRCTSLIATLRPTNGHLPVCLHISLYHYNLCWQTD